MQITRRQTMLTLARLEWDAIVHELECTPETAELADPAVAALRKQLEGKTTDPEEMVTISQPPLNWSPLIMALSLNVLAKPDLLSIAERLRDQMAMQAKRQDRPLTLEEASLEMQSWEIETARIARKMGNVN